MANMSKSFVSIKTAIQVKKIITSNLARLVFRQAHQLHMTIRVYNFLVSFSFRVGIIVTVCVKKRYFLIVCMPKIRSSVIFVAIHPS